jgi:fatty-acyl-CoA synthase
VCTDAPVAEPQASVEGTETIYTSLVAAAVAARECEFLRDGARSVTYGELLEVSDAVAGQLAGLGVKAGDRVVLWLPNGLPFAALFFACARLGAVAVMAGTRLRTVDIRHILADSDAVALAWVPRFLGIDYDRMVEAAIADRRSVPSLRRLLALGPSVVPGAVDLERVATQAPPSAVRDPDLPAVVCYTSGTTGRPKGCLHSHRALVRNASVAVGLTGLRRGDRIVCPVPFAHVFGFHMGVLQATLSRAAIVNAEPYSAERLLTLTESERGTVLYTVPAMAREAAAEQVRRPRELSSLRTTLVAGAPVSAELRRAIMSKDGLGTELSVVYGCTEAPTLTQLLPDAPMLQRLSSVGRPSPGVDVRVCVGGTDVATPAGEVGEILARGYNCMLGYLGDPQATAAKHRGDWLVTGDMGWVDAEGYVYFVGRSTEMFLVGGFNVSPREVESQLEELAGVVEAAVIGVPDERLGSVPMAFVTTNSSALGEQEILAWARDHLASYKRPRHARVLRSLPRTSSGKVARVKLEQLARRALPSLDWEAQR